MDSGMIFENRETGSSVNVCFRLFRQGDGEEFCSCIEDFYGGGYPYKEYLDEEFLLEKCAAGEMTVLCGVTPEGEIISTSAVRKDEEFGGSALLMLRVVKKAYRGMGIGKAQEERLFRYAEGQEGICSLYADVMTHNSVSQGSLAYAVGTAILSNQLEMNEALNASMIQMMEQSVTPHLGGNIDVYA